MGYLLLEQIDVMGLRKDAVDGKRREENDFNGVAQD